MALSDEERMRLEKLEQELAAADPNLDRELQSGLSRGWPAPRAVYAVLAAVPGFALVIAGIITKLTVIGVIGFVLMVASAHWYLFLRRQRFGQIRDGFPASSRHHWTLGA